MTGDGSVTTGWVVYLLRCGDGTYYAGMTNALERRLTAHREGRGARYTRGRGPLTLVFVEACASRSAALRREAALKRLRHAARQALAEAGAGGGRGRDSQPVAKLVAGHPWQVRAPVPAPTGPGEEEIGNKKQETGNRQPATGNNE